MTAHTANSFHSWTIRRLCVFAAIAGQIGAATNSACGEDVNDASVPDLPTVTTKVSSTTARVAEPLTLDLTVTAPTGSKVRFPAIGESFGDFDVIDQTDRPDVPADDQSNNRTWMRHFTLESLVTGNLEIPALEIQVHHDSESIALKSDAIPVRILSVLEDRADPMKFRDIQTVLDVSVPTPVSRTWIWWTIGGTAGLGAIALVLTTLKKRRTWMTPDTWAKREFDQLRNSEMLRNTDSAGVTEQITTILRDYLELKFNIAAPVQTTHELLQSFETTGILIAATAEKYAELFQTADLTRFAGLRLSATKLQQTIDDAERLIEQTSVETRNGRNLK
jgi:hypothetical protein